MPRVSQLSQPSEREFPLPALVATNPKRHYNTMHRYRPICSTQHQLKSSLFPWYTNEAGYESLVFK
jgi:hypothetical protein